uniref:Neural cell adhesion molecule 2 n=1 Tax=Xenopus tropicalis TaxID=8364 RepID=F6W155_XENTR
MQHTGTGGKLTYTLAQSPSLGTLSLHLLLIMKVSYFYLLGLLVSSGQALMQVTISLSKVEISVGQSKYFTCTVIGEADNIDWFNPQGEKIISGQRVVVQREGIRSWLTIYKANVDDAGIYRCQATDSKGHAQEATVVLEIYQKLTFEDVPSPQEFKRGENAEVLCLVSSSPAPMVRWLNNREDVTDIDDRRFAMLPNNNLQIKNISKRDEGIYRCEGRVEVRGEIDFRDISVIVNVPPEILAQQRSFNATADRLEDITLFCRATGSPKPYITWHRNGKLVEENEKYDLREDNTELTVKNIISTDSGLYVCRATNKAGFTEKQSFLQVFDVPSSPYGLRVIELSQTYAKVFFNKPDSHGGVPIHHYQMDFKEVSSEIWKVVRSHGTQTIIVLGNLDANTTYEVKVAAVNGKGKGEYSKTEIFQTLPVREPSPPSIHGQPGGGKSFKLSITKQDDGGAPILNYVVKYRSKDKEDQWLEKKFLGNKDYIILDHLQWNVGYEVHIIATNRLGHSEPTVFEFLMPPKPNIIADTLFSGLGVGAVIGLAVAALLLVLVVTDVSCFFIRQCGLLMCITRRICGKKSGSSGKSKELEEGKAAYLKLLLKEENGKEALSAEAIEIKISNDIIQTTESDSKA